MSATKGPSNLYGNPAGIPTEHINYPYAVTFNQRTLMKHYNDHGDEVGATGTVITYYIPDRGEAYWEDVKRKHSV